MNLRCSPTSNHAVSRMLKGKSRYRSRQWVSQGQNVKVVLPVWQKMKVRGVIVGSELANVRFIARHFARLSDPRVATIPKLRRDCWSSGLPNVKDGARRMGGGVLLLDSHCINLAFQTISRFKTGSESFVRSSKRREFRGKLVNNFTRRRVPNWMVTNTHTVNDHPGRYRKREGSFSPPSTVKNVVEHCWKYQQAKAKVHEMKLPRDGGSKWNMILLGPWECKRVKDINYGSSSAWTYADRSNTQLHVVFYLLVVYLYAYTLATSSSLDLQLAR